MRFFLRRGLLIGLWLGAALPMVTADAAPAAKPAAAAAKPTAKPKKTPPAKPKPAPAAPKPTLARDPWLGAIVVDAADGRVLFEDNADAKGYPASVLKLMLLLTAMEQIKEGKLTLLDDVKVSSNAVTDEGADLRLKEGEVFPVEELLYALMIHSANDVAIAMAEKLGGSLDGYLEIINRRARELGMTKSHFVSANGLGPVHPDGRYDVTTPRDLALLCQEILKYPEALQFTSAREHIFRPKGGKNRIVMETHNYILDMVKGCDGLKTGYIRAAGYCIAGTAQCGGRRVITVILGATSEESRNKRAARLLEKGLAAPPAKQ